MFIKNAFWWVKQIIQNFTTEENYALLDSKIVFAI